MKTYTSEQLLEMAPKVNREGKTFSKWYRELQLAKKQHGNRVQKIEAIMPYISFNSDEEEDECFHYLMINLEDYA